MELRTYRSGSALKSAADQCGIILGTAVREEEFHSNGSYRRLVVESFNCIYPENSLKMNWVCVQKGQYDFEMGDALVDWAVSQGLKVRGNCLLWHHAVPPWLEQAILTKDECWKWVEAYLRAVVGRYRGKVFAWDVVNEMVADSDSVLRNSFWKQSLPSDFLARAFRTVREADPDAVLCWCDYGVKDQDKWNAIADIASDLKQSGVPIDAISFQLHSNTPPPYPLLSPRAVERQLQRFKSLGFEIHCPEIVVWNSRWIPNQVLQQRLYAFLTSTALKYCQMIGFWSAFDAYPWVWNANFQCSPGLWDERFQPKAGVRLIEDAIKSKF